VTIELERQMRLYERYRMYPVSDEPSAQLAAGKRPTINSVQLAVRSLPGNPRPTLPGSRRATRQGGRAAVQHFQQRRRSSQQDGDDRLVIVYRFTQI